jgi:Surface antigen variable number repeat
MQRICFVFAAGLTCQGAIWAQTQTSVAALQEAVSLIAGRGGAINMPPLLRPDTGRPFSAIATTQTAQTLLDGTHVSQTTASALYRDAEGRTRVETSEPGAPSSEPVKSIMIRDPGAGTYRLDPARKTALKLAMAGIPVGPASSARAGGRGARGANPSDSNSDIAARRIQVLNDARRELDQVAATYNGGKVSVDDLGTLTVNGIPARGTRLTTLVPVGAIGNDKEFHSVTERWFSSDLNLLVKSVSTDPRFGTTTYELTNISRQAPDPSLFQVPADYRILGDPSALRQPAQPAPQLIDEIEVRGAKHVPPDTLKAIVHSKPGDVYSEEAVRNDFAALWNTGRFNDVQVNTETGLRGVIIRFVVTER